MLARPMFASRFFRAAALSLGAGLAVQASKMAATLGAVTAPAWLPDATHLVIVGGIGFAILGLLVPPDVDPRFQKGPAPRAYYTFALGLALRAFAAPFAEQATFYAALTLAGQLLEIAALAMLALARTRPA